MHISTTLLHKLTDKKGFYGSHVSKDCRNRKIEDKLNFLFFLNSRIFFFTLLKNIRCPGQEFTISGHIVKKKLYL